MSRHHDSNIDPFNAGEPVMPEDTQPSDFLGDACSFADKDYSAPRKRPDAYRAPTDNSPASVADKRAHRAWKAAFKTRDGKTNQKSRASNHIKSSSSSSKTPARRSKLAIFIPVSYTHLKQAAANVRTTRDRSSARSARISPSSYLAHPPASSS